jgi:hypothetical protein
LGSVLALWKLRDEGGRWRRRPTLDAVSVVGRSAIGVVEQDRRWVHEHDALVQWAGHRCQCGQIGFRNREKAVLQSPFEALGLCRRVKIITKSRGKQEFAPFCWIKMKQLLIPTKLAAV